MGGSTRQAAARLEWLDLYRGLAVLVMIETHVCNTFLATAHWPVEWRVRLDYLNGLVAPAFLFIAGYAYSYGLRRKRNVRSHAGRRLLRLGGIAAIGYAMHIPWAELGAGRWAEALTIGTRMDILPCLAFAIAALVVVDRFFEKHAQLVVAVMAVATVFLAMPLTRWTDGPVALLAMVNQNSGSLFPLLPWVAFTYCGFLASGVASPRGFATAVLGTAASATLLGRVDHAPASPAFFLERLAWIMLLVPICRRVATRWSPEIVLFAGRESLAMYVLHLLIISQLVALHVPQMGVVGTFAALVAILAATFTGTWGWRRASLALMAQSRVAL